MIRAFDQAFALLKVDFTFDPKEVAGEEGEGEESKGFWTTEWDDLIGRHIVGRVILNIGKRHRRSSKVSGDNDRFQPSLRFA